MEFKSLHLENYQAHKNTLIDFKAGLNIIIGESDMGKSSILRALRKLVRDYPAGKDFINEDATSMKLSLTVVDDVGQEHIIIRQVTPSKNLYYLDTQEFGGFGREIPKEIQDTLEMFLVELENNEKIDFHFSDQYDTPFMVTKGSAGTRSKLLGRIVGLHTLDHGIVNVNKDIRAGNSTLKAKSMDKVELQKVVDNSVDTSKGHKLYDTCTMQLQEITGKLNTLYKLQDLRKQFFEVVKVGRRTKQFLNDFPEIVVDFHKMREDIHRLSKLQNLYTALNSIETQIKGLPVIEVDIDIDFSEVCKNIQKLTRLQELGKTLNRIESEIIVLTDTKLDPSIEKAQKEWAKILTDLEICPLCKQSVQNIKNIKL